MSVALLLGSVNAACVNYRPAPVPLAASAAGDAPTPVWTSRAGRRFTGQLQVEGSTLALAGSWRRVLTGTTDSQLVSIRPSATRLGTVYRIVSDPDPVARPIASLHWPISAPVTVGGGGQVLLGGADGTIRALRTDGREIWRVQVWRPVEVGPIPVGDGLIAVGGNGDLHRFRQ